LVAKTLGLPWHFVSYNNKQWQRWVKTEQFKHYVQKIHSHVSVPTIQAWPAVWQLLTDKVFAPDCIVVPGHTGDFISGGHVPDGLLPCVDSPLECVTRAIIKKHYRLRPLSKTQLFKWQKNLNTQIDTMMGNSTSRLPASLFEEWEWQERQAKYIANSNRYYDSFGLDWWMPLWDQEVADFWATVPYEYKRHHRLWIDFVKSLWQAKTSISPGLGHSHDETVKLKRVIKHAASGLIHTSLIQRWRHQQKLFGIIPLLEGIKLDLMGIRMGVAVPSYLTGLTLKYCTPDIKK
jgi:asparagine synthase (glutamine-hydrolysing)